MKMFIGSKGTVGTLKSNSYHFEETNPEEDAASVEVRLTSRASSDNDEEELGAPGMEEEGANTAADNNNNCAAGSVPTTLTGRQDEGADESSDDGSIQSAKASCITSTFTGGKSKKYMRVGGMCFGGFALAVIVSKSVKGIYDNNSNNNNNQVMNAEAVARGKDIRGFDFVGDGNCLDEDDAEYDYVQFDFVYSAKDCSKLCTECPGGGQASSKMLIGFVYNYKCPTCYCLVENGGVFNDGVCGANTYVKTDNAGTGEIADVTDDDIEYRECYKVNLNSKSSKSPKNGKISKPKPKPRKKLGRKLGQSHTDMRRHLCK